MELDAKLRADLSRFLPADLLQQLPERRALRDAVQRLGSLYTSVSSFLPTYIVENEAALGRDSGQLRPGTFMFADVSGFTALSEKLQARGGSEGVEILTQIINDYFARMLEIIAKSDGQLLKFAGDALLAFFPQRPNERMDEAEKAIRTGLRMQRAMQEHFQPIQHPLLIELFGDHDLELKMSIGISRGELFEALVGNTSQRDHIIQGRLPGMAEAAEEVGVRDDVIIDKPLYETFHNDFTIREVGEGFYLVVDDLGDDLGDFEFHIPRRRRAAAGAFYGLVETDPIEELRDELVKVQTVACYVASEVVTKLAITAEHVTSENRPATVIFSHVNGFADMLDAWGPQEINRVVVLLSRYYTIMQRIIATYGGVLTRTDPYKNGFKMLITFGAPVAHFDDPERAVMTTLAIKRELEKFNQRLLEELPPELHMRPFIEQRFGITHGQVFAGEAGWRARREYTVMGDDVNLAARLMGKAEFGDILISARAWKRVRDIFETETLAPMALKGKTDVVQAYRIIRPNANTEDMPLTSDTPFIGRELLMTSLTDILRKASEEKVRGAVALVADAGVGKTRTAGQILRNAESYGFKVAWSSCQLHNDRKSTWASLVAQILEIDQFMDLEARTARFGAAVENLALQDLSSALQDLLADYLSPTRTVENETGYQPNMQSEARHSDQPRKSIFDLAGSIVEEPPKKDVTGLFQALRETIAPPETSTTSSAAIWEDLERKTSLDEAVVSFLRAFTASQPTVLVLDDIHDMNPYTLEVVTRVFNEITDAPLVVVATMEPTPGINLPAEFPRMEVSDLAQEDSQVMALKILRASEIGPKLGEFLWERSSGRPFYIESLLQTLQQQEHIIENGGIVELASDVDINALPDDIRELIVSRVDRLSPEKQAILRLAAVMNMPFTIDMMAHLTERDHIDNVRRDIRELVQAQIIEATDDNAYTFIHGVTQRTMYDSLSRHHRQKFHRTVAAYLEEQPDAERNLFVIAHHHVKAGALMRALELISTAAEQAEQVGNLELAIELYNRAQDVLPNDETIIHQLERLRNLQADSLG